ncbi:MAG: (d)CMP kinase [Clostridia bacterium]|nr:(d)CMP kinase [Clostridia bacterium]
MKAIRGAITVENDCAEEIKSAVKELLEEILKKNSLITEQIVCILFSSTNDLHSFYPAKAAREAGFFLVPLYSSIEPHIDGSLTKCIRVMLLAETDFLPKHVYLKGASALRKDITNVINIAIDGPAGSGKSTVAKIIAQKLNILCLDTGATYRACALACLRAKVDVNNSKAVSSLMDKIQIEVSYENGVQKTYLNGEEVSSAIRQNEISMLASTVSAHECVRSKMVKLQRKTAATTSCILDGRDIGTNVLPEAKFKFFLTARPDIRAQRRYSELTAKGQKVSYEELKKEIIKRDEQDKSRQIAPLKQAEDAILIDSSDMTIEEVVQFVLNSVQEKI